MTNATKFIVFASFLAGATALWAAPTTYDAGGNNTSTNAVTQTECSSLNSTDTVRIALSANVGGAIDCNGINVGIGTAAWKGRGKTYRVHTAGGASPVEESNSSRFADLAAAKSAAGAKATDALNDAGT